MFLKGQLAGLNTFSMFENNFGFSLIDLIKMKRTSIGIPVTIEFDVTKLAGTVIGATVFTNELHITIKVNDNVSFDPFTDYYCVPGIIKGEDQDSPVLKLSSVAITKKPLDVTLEKLHKVKLA